MTLPVAGTTVLLVDDEVDHLQLRAYVMKRSGFTVITAGDAMEAISIMQQRFTERVDVAVLDYQMPVMNGCALADRLRSMHPEIRIILNSGAIEIPQSEMTSVDVFIPKGAGMGRLLAKVVELAQADPGNRGSPASGNELCLRMRIGQC